MRNIIIAGNWKMNKDMVSTDDFCNTLAEYFSNYEDDMVGVIVAPPYPFLQIASDLLTYTPVEVAAQDVSVHKDGAFTGEVSASMLSSLGLVVCIVGHSERRQYHAETDDIVRAKMLELWEHNITPILCIGETLAQRDANETNAVIVAQLEGCLKGITDISDLIIAYEPIWAIGTGRTATPEQAQAVHAMIRSWIFDHYDKDAAENIHLLYGGSAKPENIASLLAQKDIDGGLIGGASLNVEQFIAMINTANGILNTRKDK